ncbi:MAG: YqcI/YcgG family protein [Acidobacteriaceae bacterium]
MTAIQQSWQSRVLDQGRLGVVVEDQWKTDSYEQYRARLRAPQYPCFFGQTAEARGEMLYSFSDWSCLPEFVRNVRKFVSLIGSPPHERSSLTAFFKPDPGITNHVAFVQRFWDVLQFLHEHDRNPATDRAPDHPLWEFAFEGCEMFVVGASPTYQRRRSRNLGPGMVLVFQPRLLFIDPATAQPIAATVRRRIHGRMLAYDEMTVHPDIGFYGNPGNREWKQYALPDDNEPETGSCPFHTRPAAHHEWGNRDESRAGNSR